MIISYDKYNRCKEIARGIYLGFEEAWADLKKSGDTWAYTQYNRCRHKQLVQVGSLLDIKVVLWPTGFSYPRAVDRDMMYDDEFDELLDMFEAFLAGEREACWEMLGTGVGYNANSAVVNKAV